MAQARLRDTTSDAGKIPFAEIAFLWFASRFALLITGVLSSYLLASGLTLQTGNLVFHEPTVRALEIWARWDAEWYLLIAAEGYDSSDHFERFGVPYGRAATAGFLPLYPLTIRTLAPVFGGVGAGVLISNLALLGALLLLYRLAAGGAIRCGARHGTGCVCRLAGLPQQPVSVRGVCRVAVSAALAGLRSWPLDEDRSPSPV